MPDFFILAIVLLFVLAIADLVVGVSNDAVNFLNSAVGSKAAPRYVIMTVASLGILLGATFSSGMMEVARTGIFNPEYFSFADVMVVFLAVMLTDVILLDFYNTFGLPTSTTVSLVFELLGTSVVVAMLKISAAGAEMSTLSGYINASSTLTIVVSILLSVGLAFTFGVAVQYLSRLLFTFQYERRLKWAGGLWSGLALSAITYFLLIKGIKGASFVPASFIRWVGMNTLTLLAASFVFWSLFSQLLIGLFRINVMRFIVLFGTFALAMAFAGNDLVNFIGVPLAGFESFKAWQGSGTAASEYSMGVLRTVTNSNTFFLVIAGIVMSFTLWFSRKARSVTDTEVNLGRQHEGLERFFPNWLAQVIVRGFRSLRWIARLVLPSSWLIWLESSFETQPPLETPHGKEGTLPAFDMVRAAVNLTVATALISLGTSYKLPLSTTYVTFMVAMGSSLADRAWGRDTAVYRVAGVLNVIGGWFATAFIAFTVSGIFAFLIFRFGLVAVAGLAILSIVFILRTYVIHRRQERRRQAREKLQLEARQLSTGMVLHMASENLIGRLEIIRQTYEMALTGLRTEDLALLKKAKEEIKTIREQNEEFRFTFYHEIRRIQEIHGHGSRAYLLVYDLQQDIMQSIDFVVKACRQHVKNSHKPLTEVQSRELGQVNATLSDYLREITQMLETHDFSRYKEIKKQKKELLLKLEELLIHQVEGIKLQAYNARNSLLYFSLLLETKDIIAVAARFAKLFYRAYKQAPGNPLILAEEDGEPGGE